MRFFNRKPKSKVAMVFYRVFKNAPQQTVPVKNGLLIIHPNGSRPVTKADLWVDFVDPDAEWGLNFAISRDGEIETYGVGTNMDIEAKLREAMTVSMSP